MGRQDVLSQDEETPAITCCQADPSPSAEARWVGMGEEDANERAKYVELTAEAEKPWQPEEATNSRGGGTPHMPVLLFAMHSTSLGTRAMFSTTLVKGPSLPCKKCSSEDPFLATSGAAV